MYTKNNENKMKYKTDKIVFEILFAIEFDQDISS